MSELANYSIETDSTVLLSFRDGRKLRVPVSQLHRFVNPIDAEKINTAMQLRHDFIRRHTPKAVLVMAAGLLGLMIAGDQAVAGLWRPAVPADAVPERSGIVRSFNQPAPGASPTVTPSVKDEPPATPAPQLATRPRRLAKPLATTRPQTSPRPLVTLPFALPQPVPSIAPDPVVELDPLVSPAPAPTPSLLLDAPPPDGQVLGDSIKPDDPLLIP